MAEYIEREAFKAEIRRLSTHYLNEWDTLGVLAAADRIPAADVVPVVRCGECKYWEEIYSIPFIGKCAFTPIRHTAEFFCANGERKDGDG